MQEKRTRKEIYDELLLCVSDPIYFIDNYAKIQHPVRGLIPFKTYHYQQDIVKMFIEHRENIIVKARQLGVTTIAAAYIAWFVLFHKDKNVVIVATKQDVANTMVRIVRTIIRNVPKYMMLCKPITNNVKSIEFSNGSRVRAYATAEDVARGDAVSLLIIDEVAHIRNMEEISANLFPTISAGGRVALFSTPKGTDNWFHEQYEQAKNGENNYNCKIGHYTNPADPEEITEDTLPWWVHPEHDQAWFDHETRGKSPREVAQEYLCSFNASGDTFLLADDITKLESKRLDPIERRYIDRCLWVWKKPEMSGKYIISIDAARGDNDEKRDYSAFHVLRIDGLKLEQVAEYKGKLTPDLLGHLAVEVAREYNNAIIAPENNSGWSGQTIQAIQNDRYPYLYYPPKNGRSGMTDPYQAELYKIQPGYTVTSANRQFMLAKMEEYIRTENILLYSDRLVSEFKTFIWNGGRPAAQRNRHDDLILSLAGGIWVREEAFMYMHRNADYSKALIEGMTRTSTSTQTFQDFNKSNYYDRSRIAAHVQNQNKIVMGNGDEIDLGWLFGKPKKAKV